MRRALAVLVLASFVAACVDSGAATRSTGATGESGPPPARGGLPDPEEPVPLGTRALAEALEATWTARRAAVDRWIREGDPSAWPPPNDVELLALFEQRLVRALASRPHLADRVLGRLPRAIAAEVGANVAAGHALYEHFTPVTEVPDFRIRTPEPADTLLGYFRAAEDRFDVDWEVLAAIMLIETRMGRIRSRSSAGAQGPMQFLPSTWEAYGLGGDVRDPEDAVMGAANYLRASGAPEDYRRALYAYNPVGAYVTAVRRYAKTMMRRPESYYAYYNWQVFVRTVDGDVRLSGPGL